MKTKAVHGRTYSKQRLEQNIKVSAADVDEISTAMSKVASLANSAGMTFEVASALLTQGIETTRESAETIGTSLVFRA